MYTETWATLNPGEMVVAVKKIGNARPFRKATGVLNGSNKNTAKATGKNVVCGLQSKPTRKSA
jgi:hypothetical protein